MNNTIYGGVTTTPVPLMFADQTYNPESENAQSGKAVEEAIQSNIDQTGDPTSPRAQSGFAVAMAVDALIKIRTDQTYSPTSENAQSGIAVAEALATVEKPWELVEDFAITEENVNEDIVRINIPYARLPYKELYVLGYIKQKDTTAKQSKIAIGKSGRSYWENGWDSAVGAYYLRAHCYLSPLKYMTVDGGVSAHFYAGIGGVQFTNGYYPTSLAEYTINTGDKIIVQEESDFWVRARNAFGVGTIIKVWGR